MNRSESFFIFKLVVLWVIGLFLIVFLAVKFLPVQKDFLGGGLSNYLSNPYFWAWGNFDGEHYLAIAQNGYQPLTYFFFPVYPIAIKLVSFLFGKSLFNLQVSGIFVSLGSFILGLVGLYKLIRLDSKAGIAKLSVILLLIFPTSFFLVSVYTESLFFALTVWSFYFARKGKWHLAGILGAFSTATRIIGLAVVAGLVVEVFLSRKENKNILLPLLEVGASILGIGFYMYFLWAKTGDPLNFLHTVGIFGAQRSDNFIMLPQVFYRYLFKVLPSINYAVLTSFFPPVLEFFTAVVFLGISILAFWKTRLSYAVYLALGYLIPTLSGSFSSLPRYVLILFPTFLILAEYVRGKKVFLFAFGLVSFILLAISFALFSRGYWIS